MGIEIINLSQGNKRIVEAKVHAEDLVTPEFKLHQVPNQKMAIWLMTTQPNQAIFPWWSYTTAIDDDVQALKDMYNITTPQSLFDSLVLSQLKKMAASELHAIFSGIIRKEGWSSLNDADRSVFENGHDCVYHLESEFDQKLSINWVPYYKPQKLVRNPALDNLWRLFNAASTDDNCNSLCMFGLSDIRKLPHVIQLLTQNSDNRSEKMINQAEWFGVYSSAIRPRYGCSLAVYTADKEVLFQLENLKNNILGLISNIQNDLISDPRPSSAIRSISRHVAL